MPAQPLISDGDFKTLFETIGPHRTADKLGCSVRWVYKRREKLERALGRQITGPAHRSRTRHNVAHPQRVPLEVYSGTVLIGSDAHLWPGPPSPAWRAFVKFCRDTKPKAVILNGDVMDFPQISRHPPIGWEKHPTVQEEIESAQEKLAEVESAAPRSSKIWTLGNHDGRFETRLATVAHEFARVQGIHLRDHFPGFTPGWSCWINDDVVIKHRFKGGVHATHNNTLSAGKSMVTGHLHSAKVTPYNDYNGVRYGVDTGCLADPDAKAFVDYTEDNPKNWRSGFALLTFHKGKLLLPELILVWDEKHVQFRGQLIRI